MGAVVTLVIKHASSDVTSVKTPATHAVRKQVRVPAMSARKTTLARSGRRDGAIGPIPPNWIPIELRFAKPHSEYVTSTSERFYKHHKTMLTSVKVIDNVSYG